MYSLLVKKQSVVGIDLRHDEIKLIQLKSHKQQMNIEKLAVAELPIGSIHDGKILKRDIVSEKLGQIVTKHDLKECPAVLAFPFNNIISKRIKLANYLNDEEQEKDIINNISHYLPGIKAELSFDFVSSKEPNNESHDALLVSARQEQIDDFVRVVGESGLKLKIIDVDAFALLRSVSRYDADTLINNIFAVLDIHATNAQFIVVQSKAILFCQHLVIKDALMDLIQQLKRALQLFMSTYSNSPVSMVLITGKKVFLSEVAQFLECEFGLGSQWFDPFSNMSISSSVDRKLLNSASSSMAVCCGLALRKPPRW